MAKVVVLGAGISGLASAALLANAGHQVTVLERNEWLGGKSRRIEVHGQRMDTGPALLTYLGVLEGFFKLFDSLGPIQSSDHINLEFERLQEVGRYYLRNHVTDLPVKEKHHWHKPWRRFSEQHEKLTKPLTELLTLSPFSLKTLAPVISISKTYGSKLTTDSYLNSLTWLPDGLREVIAIHTLNAGIAPNRTLPIYATMTAAMAADGILVPKGGINEIPQAIAKLAKAAGAEIRLGEKVLRVKKGLVQTTAASYEFDQLVSSLDPEVLSELRGKKPKAKSQLSSCSGVAIYAVLNSELGDDIVTHSVVMPDDSKQLFDSIESKSIPKQTMAFVNYYRAGYIYPNTKPTVAVLLTAPADGKHYDLNSDWVLGELIRISQKLGLEKRIDEYFEDHVVLNPEYFSVYGAKDGALYGSTKPLWQSGPFHNPMHHSPLSPWLTRVGASTHPGGGIPAVLGSAIISTTKLLKRIGNK